VSGSRTTSDDRTLVELLRAGDETAFMMLIDELGPSMRRVARMYVSTDAVADDVVQEAWLGVLKGLDGFEGRSSLRTWIFRILVNTAKTRGKRERRNVPFSSIAGDNLDAPTFDPASFVASGESEGSWSTLPFDWRGMPEERAEATETIRVIGGAIAMLPPLQAEVIRMRDVLGWSSEEVRNALDISETNQRVLLHRARAKVRQALEEHFRIESEGAS
jgi:RNA polymerase sigma-70 factor (ECF subfamily)